MLDEFWKLSSLLKCNRGLEEESCFLPPLLSGGSFAPPAGLLELVTLL